MSVVDTVTGFFGGVGKNIFGAIVDTVDRFVQTKDEASRVKQEVMKLQNDYLESERQFRLKLQEQMLAREKEIEQTVRAELAARKTIMLAELNQGDLYTKRARPTILYAGLVLIGFEVFGLRPFILSSMSASPDIISGSKEIFTNFLYIWGTVAGVYTIGRSTEKYGKNNSWTRAITGQGQADSSDGDRATVQTIMNKVQSDEVLRW